MGDYSKPGRIKLRMTIRMGVGIEMGSHSSGRVVEVVRLPVCVGDAKTLRLGETQGSRTL